MNQEAASIHYRALNHAGNGCTEIRIFDKPYVNGKSFFVWNEKEFLERLTRLHEEKVRSYVGINQRSIRKKEDSDVIAWNAVYLDIEGSPHCPETKPFALELVKTVDNYLQKQGLCPAVAETAAGYNIFVFPEEPIEINEGDRPKLSANLQAIKQFLCNKFTHPKAHIDPSVFNPSRVAKVIGSHDFKWNASTSWIRAPLPTENAKFDTWVSSLPKAAAKPLLDLKAKTPKKCDFCEYALTHQLPEGGRYERVSPSMAAYVRGSQNKEELHRQFQAVQDPSNLGLDTLDSWDNKPSDFWCGQLQHYAKDNGLWDSLCKKCAGRWIDVKISGLPA